jgi:hypothetical protein
LITYTYIVGMNGELVFLTKSIGYGLPYGTQYSNPQKQVTSGSAIILPQAEPNGLFIPDSADGTWIIAVDDNGKTHPLYVEPRVIVSPFPLKNAK